MTASTETERYKMKMYVKDSVTITAQELEDKYVARFKDLVADEDVFADIKTAAGRRRHFHVISEGGHLGPAKITTPHNFHISYLEVPPGSSAGLHARGAPERWIAPVGSSRTPIASRTGRARARCARQR